MTENDRITQKQSRFILELLTSKSVLEAGQRCGIGEKTAYRWIKLPQVQNALMEAENRLIFEAMRRLLGLQNTAIETLREIMENPQAKDGDRLRAVQTVFEYALKMREMVMLDQRITDLEKRFDELSHEIQKQN